MTSIYDVPTDQLIRRVAEELKKVDAISPPDWAHFVKTGAHKERPPVNLDWWYTRSASVLRKVAILGPIGTAKLKAKYGGKKNRGMKAERRYDGSGNIIRKILQQLESAGLLVKEEKLVHRGRKISKKGQSFLDKAASSLYVPFVSTSNNASKSGNPSAKESKKSDSNPKVRIRLDEKKEDSSRKESIKQDTEDVNATDAKGAKGTNDIKESTGAKKIDEKETSEVIPEEEKKE